MLAANGRASEALTIIVERTIAVETGFKGLVEGAKEDW